VPLQAAIAALGADRVMFSIDYPYESSELAGRFMDDAPLSGDVSARVAHANAEALLGLRA
jgi:2,3-dihydroxybenzoate decarboxylase